MMTNTSCELGRVILMSIIYSSTDATEVAAKILDEYMWHLFHAVLIKEVIANFRVMVIEYIVVITNGYRVMVITHVILSIVGSA